MRLLAVDVAESKPFVVYWIGAQFIVREAISDVH